MGITHMFAVIATFINIMLAVGLASFTAARAWWYPPTRWLVSFIAVLAALIMLNFQRSFPMDAATGYLVNTVTDVLVGLLSVFLLLLLSSLFMPEWWQGQRPIRWIVLPYLFFIGLLLFDAVAGTRLIVQPGTAATSYRLESVNPGGRIVTIALTLSWSVQLILLIVAFTRSPAFRPAITLLVGAIVFASAINSVLSYFIPALAREQLSVVTSTAVTATMIGVLCYVVLRTTLLIPTKVALDRALQVIDEAVIVADQNDAIVYANNAAVAFGITADHPLPESLHAAAVDADMVAHLTQRRSDGSSAVFQAALGARMLEWVHSSIYTKETFGGTLLLARDMTDAVAHTRQIEDERARLTETVDQLNRERHEREQLAETIRTLSLPTIPVLRGVLVMPLVGDFNEQQQTTFVETLLRAIEQQHAHRVLIDVTGVAFLDFAGARALLQGIAAAELLGARGVLVGVRPELAQTLVALGLPLDTLENAATLQEAVQAIKDRPSARVNGR